MSNRQNPVIHLAEKRNGIGIISEFTVNNTPNKLSRCAIEPTIEIPIGLAANDLHNLTPVALELKHMIADYANEICPDNKETPVPANAGSGVSFH